jgi:glycosyltransferase involved in cell wall biosynthesis
VSSPAIDLVLPCLDEAEALPWVLSRIPEGARAIVVDNGSTDGSAQVAAQFGAVVVACADRGSGAACHAGLEAATAPLVAFCDCDGSLHPADALVLAERLTDGYELAVCRRRPVSRAAWSLFARVANKELARRVRRRTSTRIVDVGPLRVARREQLLALNLRDRRSGYPVETVVRAADAGWRIAQVDVDYLPRIGTSKVSGTLAGSLRAVRDASAVLST